MLEKWTMKIIKKFTLRKYRAAGQSATCEVKKNYYQFPVKRNKVVGAVCNILCNILGVVFALSVHMCAMY